MGPVVVDIVVEVVLFVEVVPVDDEVIAIEVVVVGLSVVGSAVVFASLEVKAKDDVVGSEIVIVD